MNDDVEFAKLWENINGDPKGHNLELYVKRGLIAADGEGYKLTLTGKNIVDKYKLAMTLVVGWQEGDLGEAGLG